jgi:nucleoside-diphosphate-sugar epimerase
VPSGEHRESESVPPTTNHAPRVAVLGASGYAGALAAQLLQRHPGFELVALTSRSDVGKRLDALYPRYRVPLTMEELDLDRHADGLDAAVVAYPHHAAAPVVAGLLERGVRVVDLSADFRLRTLAPTSSGTERIPLPTSSMPPSTASRSLVTATPSDKPTSSPTPAVFRPPRCSACSRSRAPGCCETS